MPTVTSKVSIRALGKRFGDTVAVSDASIEIEDGEFLVLVGPSGSGKSTVLRMIAGLEDPSEGSIAIGERDVTHLAPKDRDIAMVFQDYALYPHMTVYDNMAFALQSRRAPRRQIEERVQDAARILNIESLLARYPAQLSGGQRQRVAMGRAIVRQPKVFLFDEPLSNLDAKLRVQMRTEIKRLHQRLGTTIVYVTHDQVEAMTLASRIVIMRNGLIEQIGTPEEVYHRPVNRFVAGFVGSPSMNFIPCELEREGAMLAVSGGGRLSLRSEWQLEIAELHGTPLLFGIRPENLLPSSSEEENSLEMTVEVVEPLGSDTLVIGRIGDTETIARFPQGSTVRPADRLWVAPDMTRAHVFNADRGERLMGHR